jgi:hypothetical protein
MKRSNVKSLSSITLLLAVVLATLVTTSALAQEVARVYVQPVEAPTGQLAVDVIAENVTDMYGAEFRLKYDPTKLAVADVNANQEGVQIAPGSLLSPDSGFIVANDVNEAEGSIVFAMTLLNPAPPVSGSGPLARVTLNVLQEGSSTIDVERAKLVAFDLQTIPSQTEALAVGSTGQPAAAENGGEQAPAVAADSDETVPAVVSEAPAPTAESSFPWWIVAAGVMVMGVLALGGFIILGGLQMRSMAEAAPSTPESTGSSANPDNRKRSRPSAFKK